MGDLDAPVNTQWQTIAGGKAEDKWERRNCRNEARRRAGFVLPQVGTAITPN